MIHSQSMQQHPRCCSLVDNAANSAGVVMRENKKGGALSKVQKLKKRLSQSFGKLAITAKEAGGAVGGGGAASSGGVMVVDILKDDSGCERFPTPSKLKQLRYAGYSAEYLDRVEPNGNIPHKQIEG